MLSAKRLVSLIIFYFFFVVSYSQNQLPLTTDSMQTSTDTVKSIFLKIEPPTFYPVALNRFHASVGNKVLRAFGYGLGLNLTLASVLLILPDNVTMWGKKDKFKWPVIREQYKNTFTKPPVFDKDLWYINYVGHPYQGAYYYNCMRSQGATMLESSLFSFGQSVLWEYVWEGGMEQPSIQDLIVTPVLGSLLGELSHVATLQMSKQGYQWYEKVLICVINPTYAINNGFKVKHVPPKPF